MKKSSKPKFDNILLKRWLLKVGPARRKTLLTKFRADLVRLGLSKFAWRKGLLQLSSRPIVRLIREQSRGSTTQMTRKNHLKDPKSRIKDAQATRDNNNNHRNNHLKQEFSHVSSSSSKQKHRKQNERRSIITVDLTEEPKCSTSGVSSNDLKKLIKTEKSEKVFSSESRRNKSENRLKRKRKHRVKMQGDNPNGITWRLIPFEMENPLKSPGLRAMQLKEVDKIKKKARLYAKLIEIFGEDIEPSEPDISAPNTKTHETSKTSIPKKIITCDKKVETQETIEALNRKSPTFSNRGKKRRRESRAVGSEKKLKTANYDIKRDSVTSDNTSIETVREETNPLQHDSLITNSAESTVPLVGDQMTVNSHNLAIEEFNADSCTWNSSITEKGEDSGLVNNCKREKWTGRDTQNSGLTLENDNHSDTTDASLASLETQSMIRQQSVIVKFNKDHGQSVEASSIESDTKFQLKSVTNENKADFTHQVEISSALDDSSSTSEVAVDNTESQLKNLPETRTSSSNRNLKNEPVDQFHPLASPPKTFDWVQPPTSDKQHLEVSSNSCSPDVLENDPSPSSTTDTELSSTAGSGMSCISNRLLGVLDNIYLALHCRRRVCEREQTASKLAIMRNRQEEVLKAKHEYESKLIIFRDELGFLFSKLGTWDRVLRFIAQGLDHRTPAGIKPFTAAEVQLAMHEAEVKIPISKSEIESSAAPPKPRSVGQVLCTIDLTDDDHNNPMRDPCDSSTDPPRSQNHININTKSEPDVDAVDGSWGHDLNANEIREDLPSIEEVKTISPQQFEKIEEKLDSSSIQDDDPCYLCYRASVVACGQCTKATYCSKVCQEIHWIQSHHATCVPLEGVIRQNK